MNKIITIAACLTATVLLHAQTTIFVTPNGTGDGTSWTNACNLETAIAVAERSRASTSLSDRTEIWVQKGTYYPSKMLTVPDSVKIYGGFAGIETALSQRNFTANPTIVDAKQKFGSVFRLENSAEINGFTIQNGYAQGNPHLNGGGIWAAENCVIENCVIIHNAANKNGGGIYANGRAKIINCNIENNTAGENGGNMYGYCLTVLTNATCVAPPLLPGASGPVMTTQPNSAIQAARVNTDYAALSVAVSGTAPFTYQWYVYENGQSSLIPDATNSSYIPHAPDSLGDVYEGVYYYCAISNDYGTAISELSGLHTAVDSFYCNHRVPNFAGGTLGTVSFKTAKTWTVSGNGIEQIWSDVVMAEGCNKTIYHGGIQGNFSSDCRANSSRTTYGDLFSWCAVIHFADVLCPSPWRVPVTEDFMNLDKAFGGYGDGTGPGTLWTDANGARAYRNTTIYNKYLATSGTSGQFWGATYGGYTTDDELKYQGTYASYWSLTEMSALEIRAYAQMLNTPNYTRPQLHGYKGTGYALRCVR